MKLNKIIEKGINEHVDDLVEEAFKTFTPGLSKSLQKTTNTLSGILPRNLGGNSMRNATLSIQRNRDQMAQNLRAARKEGGSGRLAASYMSKNNNKETYQGPVNSKEAYKQLPEYQKLKKGGWFSNGMTSDQAKQELDSNSGFYLDKFGPGKGERLTNALGRGREKATNYFLKDNGEWNRNPGANNRDVFNKQVTIPTAPTPNGFDLNAVPTPKRNGIDMNSLPSGAGPAPVARNGYNMNDINPERTQFQNRHGYNMSNINSSTGPTPTPTPRSTRTPKPKAAYNPANSILDPEEAKKIRNIMNGI